MLLLYHSFNKRATGRYGRVAHIDARKAGGWYPMRPRRSTRPPVAAWHDPDAADQRGQS